MDKSDIAGILGLLLGGAGGYYGGKRRGEREDKKLADYFDMMKELQGGSDGTTNTVPEVDLGPTEAVKVLDPDYGYTGETMNMLIDNLPNTRFGSTADTYDDPLAEYFRDDDKAINTEDLAPLLELEENNSSLSDIPVDPLSAIIGAFTNQPTYEDQKYNPFFENPDGTPKTQFNDGGRVGLANGGLGYSYKNNIFSADPSTGIPAIVDAGGDDGVVDDTFIDLFPGLFPPVETPAENILDTPVMPMGGGGGDGFKFGDLDNYGINPMYGEGSGYDPDDPENSFLDKLGYGFYSNVMKPGAMLAKKLPTPMNIVSNLLGDQDFKLSDLFSNLDTGKGDPDPKPGPKTPSVNSTGGIGDKQKKSGGGGGGGYSGKGTKDPGGQEARGV